MRGKCGLGYNFVTHSLHSFLEYIPSLSSFLRDLVLYMIFLIKILPFIVGGKYCDVPVFFHEVVLIKPLIKNQNEKIDQIIFFYKNTHESDKTMKRF